MSRIRSGSRRQRSGSSGRIAATSAAVGAQPVAGAAQGFDGAPAERFVDRAAQMIGWRRRQLAPPVKSSVARTVISWPGKLRLPVRAEESKPDRREVRPKL